MVEGTIKKADGVRMYDYSIIDGQQIVVEEECPRWELVNEYFAEHKLRRSDYTDRELDRLIEAVMFTVQDEADQEVIDNMLV